MNDLILYTTEDGRSQIKLRADQQTVWLTQLEMAELFDATKQNISLHLKNIFEDGELGEGSVVKESLTTAAGGKGYVVVQCNRRAISPLPIRYTACSEFPSPAQLGNSQGMLDISNLRALTKKWQASHRSATRYAASFAVTALEATTDESLLIREDGGASP